MATYNGAAHLRQQLESMASQSLLPDELVVGDDCSTDGTVEILERFSKRAPFPVHITRNEKNLGFAQNFGAVMSRCSGDLVALSDQDDVWFSDKLETISAASVSHPHKLVFIHDGELVDEALIGYGVTKLEQVRAGYGSLDRFVMGALTVVRRDFLQLVMPVPPSIIGHDVWIHEVARHMDARWIVPQRLQYLRRHSANTSGWIASSVQRKSKFDVFVSELRSSVAESYEDRKRFNIQSRKILAKIIDSEIGAIYGKAIHRSLADLAAEAVAIEYREHLLHAGTFRRKILALMALINGHYRYFNGYRSFARDILR